MPKFLLISVVLLLCGCASLKNELPSQPDMVSQQFFSSLRGSDPSKAHEFFAKGLSQTISQDQWEGLMETLLQRWGRLESHEEVVMPFHQRVGESSFIPLGLTEDKIKRYVYELKFERAQINCDLTLAFDGQEYRIVWVSFWGSSIYMTPEINDKIQELFTKPAES